MRTGLALASSLLLASAATASFDVPRLDGIAIDGDDADWRGRGFRVDLIAEAAGRVFAPGDLDARWQVGWDDAGLLVCVRVSDDVRDENPDDDPLGRNDSVEVFVSAAPGSAQRYQFTVAAGAPGATPRTTLTDRRADRAAPAELRAEAATRSVDGGYVVEMRLPWANFGRDAKPGDAVGLQLRANDTDKGPRKSVFWFPVGDSYTNPNSVQPLVLARDASPPVQALARGEYARSLAGADVRITAVAELAGRIAEVRQGDRVLRRATLAADAGRASALVRLPMPRRGEPYPPLTVTIDGRPAATLDLPDAEDARARRLMDLPVAFQPSVFNGTEFPRGDFEEPHLAEQILGPYEVRTTYYDADYNVVTSAERPGRYGAVIEFVPADGGRVVRRFRTLYRPVKPLEFWAIDPRVRMDDPAALGLDPETARAGAEEIGQFWNHQLGRAATRDGTLPALLAAFARPLPAGGSLRRNDGAEAQDRQWWVGLKRKLNGWDARWPAPFVCPRPVEGAPAAELREGTPEQAGMTVDGVRRIDALCDEWAANSDEPFAVCIARRGVVVLHKAYGRRDGRPLTLDDKSWMASITKAISGTAMMMLVDQGLVRLDDPVEKFLPAFARTPVATPATIHHLYTHTAGLWEHWGDDMHDFDEAVGEYYPRLKVGKARAYNGASQAVGGKVIEAVTGEALPTFYLNHLLGPLGMARTDVTDSSAGAAGTAHDLAKFGQMLLNGGAYGTMRFLRPETVDAMMPRRLTELLGPDTNVEWGMGLVYYPDSPLGPRTFGHGAASSALLRVSPERDVVLVMTRNAAGEKYKDYEPRFLQAVADAIADGPTTGAATP